MRYMLYRWVDCFAMSNVFFRHKGTKAQSSTKIISILFPLPYSLFLLSYYLFLSATKALRHKVSRIGFTQSSQGSKAAKVFSFPPSGGLPLPYSLFLLSYLLFPTTQRPFKETLLRTRALSSLSSLSSLST